jgi:hypothetical protein
MLPAFCIYLTAPLPFVLQEASNRYDIRKGGAILRFLGAPEKPFAFNR